MLWPARTPVGDAGKFVYGGNRTGLHEIVINRLSGSIRPPADLLGWTFLELKRKTPYAVRSVVSPYETDHGQPLG